jgi:hypothetical protein
VSPEHLTRDAADLALRLLPVAVQGVGPLRDSETHGQYMERVRALAIDLWIESGPRSELARRLAELMSAQVFVGILTAVEIEPSSTRAILTLTVIKDGESAEETIRTDRTDGPAGRALWEVAKALVGHRVAIYKQMEARADPNKKYRCAKHIVDLGAADDPEEATGARPADGRPADGRPADGRAAGTAPLADGRPAGTALPPEGQPAGTAPPLIARRRPGAGIADARCDVTAALERAGHSDPAYRDAACAGIMDRVVLDGVVVTNLDALLHLASTTPPAGTPAGRMITQRYGQPPERMSA